MTMVKQETQTETMMDLSNDPSDGLDEIIDQMKDRDNGNTNNQDDDGVQGSPSIDDLASPFF